MYAQNTVNKKKKNDAKLYIAEYIRYKYHLNGKFAEEFVYAILWQLLNRVEKTRKIIDEGNREALKGLNDEIENQMQDCQSELEKKMQAGLDLIEKGFDQILKFNVGYAFVGAIDEKGYLRRLNNNMANKICARSGFFSANTADIFMPIYEETYGQHHKQLNNTYMNLYSWSNYLFLASNFIDDPGKRYAIAERAMKIKDKVGTHYPKLANQMISNETKFLLTALTITAASIIAASILTILLPFTLPFVIPAAVVLSGAGVYLGVIALVGLVQDKRKINDVRTHFEVIDDKNHELIRQTKNTLKSEKQKGLSHSVMTKAMEKSGDGQKDKQRESKEQAIDLNVTAPVTKGLHSLGLTSPKARGKDHAVHQANTATKTKGV